MNKQQQPFEVTMSAPGDSAVKEVLNWRRLFLSRAKLKAVNRTSALLSGFAMVAMVEAQLDTSLKYPDGLLVTYAVITCLLVAVHLLALMVSTCILPHLEATTAIESPLSSGDSPQPDHLHWYIELAWISSTGVGIFLFLTEIVIICWVKFYGTSRAAAITATVLIVPVLIIFLIFALHFYRQLVSQKYDQATKNMEVLEHLRKTELDELNPVAQGVTGSSTFIGSAAGFTRYHP